MHNKNISTYIYFLGFIWVQGAHPPKGGGLISKGSDKA
jgi:hypothetical protein